jgi:hypothetical protein
MESYLSIREKRKIRHDEVLRAPNDPIDHHNFDSHRCGHDRAKIEEHITYVSAVSMEMARGMGPVRELPSKLRTLQRQMRQGLPRQHPCAKRGTIRSAQRQHEQSLHTIGMYLYTTTQVSALGCD